MAVAVLRPHVEDEGPVPLAGQRVGQHHETPPPSGVHGKGRVGGGDVRPGAVDEDGEADKDLRGPAAIGIDRRHLAAEGRAAHRHALHLDVVELHSLPRRGGLLERRQAAETRRPRDGKNVPHDQGASHWERWKTSKRRRLNVRSLPNSNLTNRQSAADEWPEAALADGLRTPVATLTRIVVAVWRSWRKTSGRPLVSAATRSVALE